MPQPVRDIIWQNSNISHPEMKTKRKKSRHFSQDKVRFREVFFQTCRRYDRKGKDQHQGIVAAVPLSLRQRVQAVTCKNNKEEEKRWSSKLKSWLISHLYSHTHCHNWKPASTRWWPNNCWPVEQLGAKCLAQGYPQGQFSKRHLLVG